jgi:hypothetical protein
MKIGWVKREYSRIIKNRKINSKAPKVKKKRWYLFLVVSTPPQVA